MRTLSIALALSASLALAAQTSDIPLGLNLPNTEQMQFWDMGLRFTHRFLTPVKGNGKDAYGLDGYAFSGIGLDFGIKPIKGLNLQLYRSSDEKTFTMALHYRVYDGQFVRMAARVERFDETVQQRVTVSGDTIGLTGGAFQIPVDFFLPGNVTIGLVPTYLSTSTSYLTRAPHKSKSLFNVGASFRWDITAKQSFIGEYYPRPSVLDKAKYQAGWALGYQFRTFKHHFTILATNVEGTTTHQVLGGDFSGGPRTSELWSLGFNVTRIF